VYSLCLKRCSLLDSTISLVGQRCRYLRELDLTGCFELTDAACEDLGKSCKDLQRLSIAGCSKITDEGVSDIARSMGGSLTALNLNRCQFICDESLTAVGESCQKLLQQDHRPRRPGDHTQSVQAEEAGLCRSVSDYGHVLAL
jgi:hypothetical protein